MSKIKIGFEITDNWNNQAFRNVIYALQDKPQTIDRRLTAGDIELFLISTDDSATYIWNTGARIGLDTSHTIDCGPGNIYQKLQEIENNQIKIFLDNLQSTVLSIEIDSEYSDGILVDSKQDYYKVNPKWYSDLVGMIGRILNELE